MAAARQRGVKAGRKPKHGRYVNAPAELVRMSMNGTFLYGLGEAPRRLPDFTVFHRYAV